MWHKWDGTRRVGSSKFRKVMEVKEEVNLTMEMGIVPCAGNARVQRGLTRERPKCQESNEPHYFWYVLPLLLGIWSCIVSIIFYSDGLNFSSTLHNIMLVATKVLTYSSVNIDA